MVVCILGGMGGGGASQGWWMGGSGGVENLVHENAMFIFRESSLFEDTEFTK